MKNLKIIIILISFILISPLLVNNVTSNPAVMVSEYSLFPDVLLPGDKSILTVTIINGESTATTTRTVSNTGDTSTLSNATVKQNGAIIQNIWISKDGDGIKDVKADKNYEDFGLLAPGGSFTTKFEIYAQKNISDGSYFPSVVVDLETAGYEDLRFPILVRVSSLGIDLVKKDVPSKIPISGSTDITFSVVNNRGGSVNSVKITPKDVSGVEFSPENVFLGSLDNDTSKDVTFSIIPKETGMKNLSFTLSYKNGDNFHYVNESFILDFVDTLDVAPIIYSAPSKIIKGSTSRFRLEVYNAKSDEISGVIITPDSLATVSPSKYFIGSMDPDDVFSVTFDVNAENLDVGKEYPIRFNLSFKQDGDYYQTPSVASFFIVSESITNDNTNPYGFLAVALIILVGFLVYYFYYYKRRKK